MDLLRFAPLYKSRPWGGSRLATALGRTLPAGTPIGESWEIVDRPDEQSVVDGGRWHGRTLRDLIEQQGAEIMGPTWPRDRRFPVLVKWLDCHERLSLQVHPPPAVAAALGGEAKTENWYFLETLPGAAVLAGLESDVDVDAFARALEAGDAERCVRRFATRAGSSMLIESGVVHAIDAGNLILEIQQSSDTTYRVSDWGRVDAKGRARELHVRQAMASIAACTAAPPALVHMPGAAAVLAEHPAFRLTRYEIDARAAMGFSSEEQPRILSVVAGDVTVADTRVRVGDSVLLPHTGAFRCTAAEPATILVTDRFAAP